MLQHVTSNIVLDINYAQINLKVRAYYTHVNLAYVSYPFNCNKIMLIII